MSAAALSVRDLSVVLHGGSEPTVAVHGISFDLLPGEVLALVGESGCGKTKTAEALMGLVPARLGSVRARRLRLGDRNLLQLSEPAMRKVRGCDISMVFQEPLTALDPVFRAGDQLAWVYQRHRGVGRRLARQAAAGMLQRVGFADSERVLSCYPHELSGGMRQRVMIAMAMACEPQVLIADEPTSALDVTTQAQVLGELTGLAQASGTSVLLITHDLGVVAQYCDRALIMRHGQLVEEAAIEQLFARPAHPYTAELLAAARGETA